MRVYTHPACLAHQPGPGHPECPARLQAVTEALRAAIQPLEWVEAPMASREAAERLYGVVLDAQGQIDEAATTRRRQAG